jgi:hypothetical protein
MVGPPQLESYTVNPNIIRDVFTTSLPLWEKINLFNTKAKYFDDGFNNPGGSWNRIGVTFRPSLNGSSSGALGSSTQFSQQYLNVVVSTNNINYTNPSSNTLNPIPFINQTVQPTIGTNPFNAVTGEYTALFSGTYSFVWDFDLTFNNPNITYSFLVYKNNNLTTSGLAWQNSNITTYRHTFGLILNAGDRIKIVGQNYSNQPYNFDCQLTMSVTGTRTNPYHLDNCLTMVVKADKLSSLRAGTILSFQNPDLTKDINLTGATLNSYETNSITGTSIQRGGGGGGAVRSTYTTADNAGAGGGGRGAVFSGVSNATAGAVNTGGGGGGGVASKLGQAGGSGTVIIRYAGAQRGTGGTVTSDGGFTIHTFTSSGTYTA